MTEQKKVSKVKSRATSKKDPARRTLDGVPERTLDGVPSKGLGSTPIDVFGSVKGTAKVATANKAGESTEARARGKSKKSADSRKKAKRKTI